MNEKINTWFCSLWKRKWNLNVFKIKAINSEWKHVFNIFREYRSAAGFFNASGVATKAHFSPFLEIFREKKNSKDATIKMIVVEFDNISWSFSLALDRMKSQWYQESFG